MKSAKMKMSRNTVYQAAAMSREPQNSLLHDSPHCTLPDPLAASIGSSMMASSASVNDASWFDRGVTTTTTASTKQHNGQGGGCSHARAKQNKKKPKGEIRQQKRSRPADKSCARNCFPCSISSGIIITTTTSTGVIAHIYETRAIAQQIMPILTDGWPRRSGTKHPQAFDSF